MATGADLLLNADAIINVTANTDNVAKQINQALDRFAKNSKPIEIPVGIRFDGDLIKLPQQMKDVKKWMGSFEKQFPKIFDANRKDIESVDFRQAWGNFKSGLAGIKGDLFSEDNRDMATVFGSLLSGARNISLAVNQEELKLQKQIAEQQRQAKIDQRQIDAARKKVTTSQNQARRMDAFNEYRGRGNFDSTTLGRDLANINNNSRVINTVQHAQNVERFIETFDEDLQRVKQKNKIDDMFTDYYSARSSFAQDAQYVSRNRLLSKLVQDINSQYIGASTINKNGANVSPYQLEVANKNAETLMMAQQNYQKAFSPQMALGMMNKVGNSFTNGIMRAFGLYGLGSSISKMIDNVRTLDDSIVDLQIASGKSRETVKEMVLEYSDLGKEYGATTKEIASAADSWLRQGYDVQSANILIRDSMMLSKLGQIESAKATQYLTSAMKGFNVEAKDAEQIVDKLVTVDMEAAVSSGDIAQAMSKTAVSAQLAGIDMNRLIGYLTTVQEVTQGGASEVGNAMKSMFARMGKIKAGKLIDTETQENISDVEVVLADLGIKLREDGSTWRNFGDILDDVNARWKDLTDTERRQVANAFGMTRNQEKFLVLMENYDQALEYANIAQNSSGNASKKYQGYLAGTTAKVNSLKASFESLSQSVFDSDTFGSAIDGITGFVSGLGKVAQFFGSTNLLSMFTTFSLASPLTNLFKNTTTGLFTNVAGMQQSMSDYYSIISQHGIASNEARTAFGNLSYREQSIASRLVPNSQESLDATNAYIQSGGIGTRLKGFAMNLGAVAATAVASFVVGTVVKAVSDNIHRDEINSKAAQKAVESANSKLESIDLKLSPINDSLKEFEKIPDSLLSDEERVQKAQLEQQRDEIEQQRRTQQANVDSAKNVADSAAVTQLTGKRGAIEKLDKAATKAEGYADQIVEARRLQAFTTPGSELFNSYEDRVAELTALLGNVAGEYTDIYDNNAASIDSLLGVTQQSKAAIDRINAIGQRIDKAVSVASDNSIAMATNQQMLIATSELGKQVSMDDYLSAIQRYGATWQYDTRDFLNNPFANIFEAINNDNLSEEAKGFYNMVFAHLGAVLPDIFKGVEDFDTGKQFFLNYADQFKDYADTNLSAYISDVAIQTDKDYKSIYDSEGAKGVIKAALSKDSSSPENLEQALEELAITDKEYRDAFLSGIKTFEGLKGFIEDSRRVTPELDGTSYSVTKINTAYNALSSAMSQYAQDGYATASSVDAVTQALKGLGIEQDKVQQAFSYGTDGIQMNTKSLYENVDAIAQDKIQSIELDIAKKQLDVSTLEQAQAQGLLNEEQKEELAKLRSEIYTLSDYKSQLELLTSAYGRWAVERSAGNTGDRFRKDIGGTINSDIDTAIKEGRTGAGNREYQAAIRYKYGEDAEGMTVKEIKDRERKLSKYDKLNKNSKTEFERAMKKAKVDLSGQVNPADVAKALGTSEEYAAELMRGLNEFAGSQYNIGATSGDKAIISDVVKQYQDYQNQVAKWTSEGLDANGIAQAKADWFANSGLTASQLAFFKNYASDILPQISGMEGIDINDINKAFGEFLSAGNVITFTSNAEEIAASLTNLEGTITYTVKTVDEDGNSVDIPTPDIPSDGIVPTTSLKEEHVDAVPTNVVEETTMTFAEKISGIISDFFSSNSDSMNPGNDWVEGIPQQQFIDNNGYIPLSNGYVPVSDLRKEEYSSATNQAISEVSDNNSKVSNIIDKFFTSSSDMNPGNDWIDGMLPKSTHLPESTIPTVVEPQVNTDDAFDEIDSHTSTINVTADTSSAQQAISSVADQTYHATIIVDANMPVITGGNGGGVKAVTRAFGNAFASGTARKNGQWGEPQSTTALVGELGQELVVDPYNGRWHTVGDNGAEFTKIPKGSIVFNHVQTEQILKNGHISTRGRALASGNARASAKKQSDNGGGFLSKKYSWVNYENMYAEQSDDWFERQQRNINDATERIAKLREHYQKKLDSGAKLSNENFQKLNKALVEADKHLFEMRKKLWEEQNERDKISLDHLKTQAEQLIDLKDAHHDLLSTIRDERDTLRKEYEIARDALPFLTEAEKEAAFSAEDYQKMLSSLQDIEYRGNKLKEDYEERIRNTAESDSHLLQYITKEYNNQLDLLKQEYSVTKSQLALTKAQKNLENAKNNRNVAMLVNGQWTWTWDYDTVKQAMQGVIDAENEYNKTNEDYLFEQEKADLNSYIIEIEKQISTIDNMVFSLDTLAEEVHELTDSLRNALPKYANGGVNTTSGAAIMHGTQSKPEVVFNSAAASKLYNFVENIPDISSYISDTVISKLNTSIVDKLGRNIDVSSNAPVTDNRVFIDKIEVPEQYADQFLSLLRTMMALY